MPDIPFHAELIIDSTALKALAKAGVKMSVDLENGESNPCVNILAKDGGELTGGKFCATWRDDWEPDQGWAIDTLDKKGEQLHCQGADDWDEAAKELALLARKDQGATFGVTTPKVQPDGQYQSQVLIKLDGKTIESVDVSGERAKDAKKLAQLVGKLARNEGYSLEGAKTVILERTQDHTPDIGLA